MRSIWNHLFLLTVLLCLASYLQAQDEEDADEESSRFASGLLLEADGGPITLVPQAFLHESRDVTALEWTGFLESEAGGEYRIAARFVGELLVEVDNQILLRETSEQLKWVSSMPIVLDYAHHPIRISLKRTGAGSSPRLTTHWSGPGFQFEPIHKRHLWHAGDQAYRSLNARGAELLRAFRCQACHTMSDGSSELPLRSPSLKSAGAYLRIDWLLKLFSNQSGETDPQSGTIFDSVHGKFSDSEARDIAAWLKSTSQIVPNASSSDHEPGDVESGRKLFMTVGCLACHSYELIGHVGPFGGGNLTLVASKRPPEFFGKWLDDPSSIIPNHRMPKFDLTDQEVSDLSAFLANGGRNSATADRSLSGNAKRGAELVQSNHCASCHDDATGEPYPKSSLSDESDWSNSCMTSLAEGRPVYRIQSDSDRAAIEAYICRPRNADPAGNENLIAENNCLQCHARGGSLGLLPVTEEVIARHASLVTQVASMNPPSLNGIGDKLLDRALRNSISRKEAVLRPWLSVRMPTYPLSEKQVERIADHFVAQDRVPDEAQQIDVLEPSDEGRGFAERMLTSEGFGCVSCHSVGKMSPPPQTPIGQLGPSLSMPKSRIRKIWFDRWVRNPARIVPKMEMPSVQIPIPGVLNGDLDRQLDAVWNILNEPRFTPPDPAPVRVVSRSGQMSEPAVALTDVLRFNGRKLIKPFLIGLPNRHNVLLDLDQARLAAWWTGDTARQRTQGKTWYWEAPVLQSPETDRSPEIVLIRDDKIFMPQRVGQFVTEPDEWSQTKYGLELKHRLHFTSGRSTELVTVHVVQRFTAIENGWSRYVLVDDLGANETIGLRHSFETATSAEKYKRLGGFIRPRATTNGRAELRLDYVSEEVVDDAPLAVDHITRSDRKQLDVMPGFRLTRLPLRTDVMPIALGWKPTGELLVASLKGRVWSATDTDGDQLEDQMQLVSDELAAPYGVSAADDHIDVLCKYGVVRLHDRNQDGVADRHELVASGWGHTDDYHDWVVGLPRDKAGNYYMTVPCQQDNRSSSAAHLRGTVLRLTPRKPDALNPQRFRLEKISGGHRFPMGIARNQAGQLFVTDNQGNYNPFNELNHVVAGARYGFINKLERKDGFSPPLTPPAIDIPHPWTRSVNGICFLETPQRLTSRGESMFGPFEGQLLGCEYDTRRLIRMSLEEVDGWIQGAVYPLAEDSSNPAAGLQGPVGGAVSPTGEIYVANIRDSGWGGGNNKGSIVRAVPDMANLPTGIAEVTAMRDGFRIRFTKPVDRDLSTTVDSYSVSSYRRKSTPAYGGDDVERRQESISAVTVANDLMSVDLRMNELRAGFVFEFRLKKLTGSGTRFYPAEAFYTLRRLRK